MGKSGNPEKAAAQEAAASVADFKKRKKGRLLTLPSGLVARVRRVELQSYVLKGDIPNPLMAMVSQALEKGQGIDMREALGVDEGQIDLEKLNEMYGIVDGLMTEMFMEPTLRLVPTQADVELWNAEHDDEQVDDPEELRSDDQLYTDELEEEDKMFLFQWAMGGTDDLVTFRREAQQDLASLGSVKGGGRKTK